MTTATHDHFDLLRCTLGNETYGIHLPAVRAIQRSDQLRRAPGAHGRVGMVHERGAAIAVYSLAGLLGRPEPRAAGLQTVVVLEGEPRPWGLLVDRAAQQLRVPASCNFPVSASFGARTSTLLHSLVVQDQELLPVLARIGPEEGRSVAAVGQLATPGSTPRAHTGAGARGHSHLVLFGTDDPERGPLRLGLSIRQVEEIVPLPPIVPLPGCPEWIPGAAAWRGAPLTVVDLTRRLGMTVTRRLCTRLIVTRGAGHLLGFPAHPAMRVLRLPTAQQPCRRALPFDVRQVRGVVDIGTETVVIPDLGTLPQLT